MSSPGWITGLYMIGARLRRPLQKPGQYTYVYCPGCRKDLVSRVGSPDGTTVTDIEDVVRYICGHCSTVSKWDFVNYPCPVLIQAHQMRYWRQEVDQQGFTVTKEHRITGPKVRPAC